MDPYPERINLGKTEIRISPLGIGAWAWGDQFYWGYGRDYSESDVKAAFDICIDGGVNFFDTAEFYGQGRSERFLGQFIQAIPEEEKRPVFVGTKFYPYPWRLWKGTFNQALRGSLKRLRRERVDLYQIHWPLPPISIETWTSALADAVDEGLISAAGVSNFNASQMRRSHAVLIKRGMLLASNQVMYSLLDRKIEKDGLLLTCLELGISCIAYSPLAQGALSGKYSSLNPPPGFRGRKYSAKYLGKIEPLLRLLREIGRAHDGKTPGQVALNWVMCKGAIPIPGVKTMKQAQENIGAEIARDKVHFL